MHMSGSKKENIKQQSIGNAFSTLKGGEDNVSTDTIKSILSTSIWKNNSQNRFLLHVLLTCQYKSFKQW